MLEPEAKHDPVDVERARLFALLGRLLGDPPDAALLHRLALPHHGPGEIGAAYAALSKAAALATPGDTRREFAALFRDEGGVPLRASAWLGVPDGPHLASLRTDLARLGIGRAEGIAEPEDHIVILFETYAGLLAGALGPSPADAPGFFEHHIRPWAARCFAAIEAHPAAVFYRAVGRLGRAATESAA
jgi:TorA maturation chaperone TorD